MDEATIRAALTWRASLADLAGKVDQAAFVDYWLDQWRHGIGRLFDRNADDLVSWWRSQTTPPLATDPDTLPADTGSLPPNASVEDVLDLVATELQSLEGQLEGFIRACLLDAEQTVTSCEEAALKAVWDALGTAQGTAAEIDAQVQNWVTGILTSVQQDIISLTGQPAAGILDPGQTVGPTTTPPALSPPAAVAPSPIGNLPPVVTPPPSSIPTPPPGFTCSLITADPQFAGQTIHGWPVVTRGGSGRVYNVVCTTDRLIGFEAGGVTQTTHWFLTCKAAGSLHQVNVNQYWPSGGYVADGVHIGLDGRQSGGAVYMSKDQAEALAFTVPLRCDEVAPVAPPAVVSQPTDCQRIDWLSCLDSPAARYWIGIARCLWPELAACLDGRTATVAKDRGGIWDFIPPIPPEEPAIVSIRRKASLYGLTLTA